MDGDTKREWERTSNNYRATIEAAIRGSDEDESVLISISLGASDFEGMSSDDAFDLLSSLGFYNITEVEVQASLSEVLKAGKVKQVTIDGNSSFAAGDEFEYGANVIITKYKLI